MSTGSGVTGQSLFLIPYVWLLYYMKEPFYKEGLLALHPTPNLADQVLQFTWNLPCKVEPTYQGLQSQLVYLPGLLRQASLPTT